MTAFRPAAALMVALGVATVPVARGAAPVQNCPDHVDVRDLMTVSQFTAAGLDKLTKQQLAALNAWLSEYLTGLCTSPPAQTRTQTGAPAISTTGAVVTPKGSPEQVQSPGTGSEAATTFGAPPKQPSSTTSQIESRIIGDFHGWTGDTIFRLENGQVWKQAGPGYFETNLKNPKVLIKKLMIGYVLIVDGYSKEVFVRRIR